MKNINYQTYSDEEKEIFNNLFINRSNNSRKIFEDYVNDYFKTLPGDKKPHLHTSRESIETVRNWNQHKKTVLNNPNKISYNTHHMIWDNASKNNLVTHFLSKSDFETSNSNMYSLNILHPDWNHQNKYGHNALMFLANRKNLELLSQIATDFKLDLNKKDKNHKYFTHFIFSAIPSEDLGANFLSRLNGHFSHVERLIDENPQHFDISHVRLGRIINEWENTMQKLTDDFSKDDNVNSYTTAISNIESHGSRILTKLLNHKLAIMLPIKDEKNIKISSIKI